MVAFDLHHCIGDVGVIALKVVLLAVKGMPIRCNVLVFWVDEPHEAVHRAPKVDAEEDCSEGLMDFKEVIIPGWACDWH